MGPGAKCVISNNEVMARIFEIVVVLGQEGDFKGKLTRWERRAVVFTPPSKDNIGWAQTREDVISECPLGPWQKIRIFLSLSTQKERKRCSQGHLLPCEKQTMEEEVATSGSFSDETF